MSEVDQGPAEAAWFCTKSQSGLRNNLSPRPRPHVFPLEPHRSGCLPLSLAVIWTVTNSPQTPTLPPQPGNKRLVAMFPPATPDVPAVCLSCVVCYRNGRLPLRWPFRWALPRQEVDPQISVAIFTLLQSLARERVQSSKLIPRLAFGRDMLWH